MNKNLYRIVFNHARGLRMAVQETASSCGKATGSTQSPAVQRPASLSGATCFNFRALSVAVFCALGGFSQWLPVAQAQVAADPSAPGSQRPTILVAPNGVPVQNITTPSAAGVSINQLILFNVGPNGVILNNSRTNVQSQLGGWVQGNPWLATGSATKIVNQINSSHPSYINGYIEVAGQRAEVIIANPSGINVNGGGFINASRATLTTGTPIINGGNLEGYVVQKGLVNISGAGLDASRTDFTGIIARAVEVNAGIWANELKVTTGASTVDEVQTTATPIAGSGAAPAFALDVALLGGMYAGKITLVGTEAGVGVRNAGNIGATAGNVVVTVDGILQNTGRIAGSAATRLDASGGISNTASGAIYSTGDTSLSTRGNISNAGLVAAQGNTTLAATGAASEVSSTAGSVLAAGLREDGTLVAATGGTGALSVSATQTIAALGQNLSTGAQSLNAGSINLADSQNSADSLNLAAGAGGIDASSAVMAVTQGLTISTPGLLRTDAAKVSAGQLTVGASALSNVAGEIVQNDGNGTGTANFTIAGQLNNTLGLISATGTLNIKDPNAGNDPAVNAPGKTLAITNTGGTLIAGQALVIDAASLSSDGKVLSQGSLNTKLLGNHTHTAAAQFQATGNASLETTGTLTNQGQLLAGQGLTLKAASLDNQAGAEIRGTAVKLVATDANTLTNRGLIDGVETVIETVTLNNLGTGRIYGDHVAIGATTLNNIAEGGVAPVIAARNRLDIGATTINNAEHALLFSGGDMAIGDSLDGAKQATGQATTLNNGSATIEALGNLTINAAQINNTNNHFSTQVVPVSSSVITEFQGSGSGTRFLAGTPGLTTYDDESLHLATPDGGRYEAWSMYQYNRSISETVVAASDPGQILSGGSMTINAANVFNDKSRIIAGGTLTGNIGTLTNTEVAGQRVITDAGMVYHYWRNHRSGRDDTGTASAGYNPGSAVQGINLTPTVYLQNTAPAGTGTSINARTLVSLGQGASVATNNPNTAVPNNSLFRINPNAAGNFLIETDPRFANYRLWLSSDYMLQQLGLDPTLTQKRLGDGFYEQKLIREQVAELTGRRFLDGYQSDEAQYQALMNNSVTFAQQYSLRPGIALSAAQMAQLTSDIVWLVEREVTLADGTKVKALVPQLYVKVKDGDLTGDGALISAGATNLNLSGDVLNSGTIAGRTAVVLNAQNVQNLAGRIRGANVAVAATNDLNNIGGQIIAADTLTATAGRDLNVASTTSTQTGGTGNRTNIDRVAGLYVTNPGGTLVASAGRDINLIAAELINNAPTAAGQPAGSTLIAAGRDLNLGTVTEASNNTIIWNSNNNRKDSQSAEVGTVIQGNGSVRLAAGTDLNARAATVQAGAALVATAGNNINITAGQSSQSVDENHQYTSKGLFSKKTTTTGQTLDRTDMQASNFSGGSVTIGAGVDVNVQASNLNAANALTIAAGRDVNLTEGHNTLAVSQFSETRKNSTGLGKVVGGTLMATGAVTFGAAVLTKSSSEQQAKMTSSTAVGSTLSAGSIASSSGRDTTLRAATLVADGDIAIAAARDLSIVSAQNNQTFETASSTKKSGMVGTILQPALGTLQKSQDETGKSTSQVGSTVASLGGNVDLRAGQTYTQTASQVLALAQPGTGGAGNVGNIDIEARNVLIKEAYNTGSSVATEKTSQQSIGGSVSIPIVDAIKSLNSVAKSSSQTEDPRMKALAAATMAMQAKAAADMATAAAAGNLGGFKVSVSISSTKTQSTSEQSYSQAQGSTVGAGGNVTINASGQPSQGQGNITIIGSDISAGQNVDINAEGQLDILAAKSASAQHSTNSSQGTSVGIGFAVGGAQNGFTLELAASKARGNADGNDTGYTNSHITGGSSAGDTVTLKSGSDTILKGAVIAADTVKAEVGGNLNIESLQDSATFDAKQNNSGFSLSLCIPPFCYGTSTGSVSAGKSKIGSDFQSVAEQSGIKAGDGGFQVDVAGNTALKGSVIASTDYAVDTGANSFTTGGALSISDIQNQAAYKGSAYSVTVGSSAGTSSAGIGKDKADVSSTSSSGISGIAGNTAVRSTDAETGIKPIFDAAKVQNEINAQVAITQAFSREAPKAVADFAAKQGKDLKEQAKAEQDAGKKAALLAEASKWEEGGIYRIALHTAAGALSGGLSGAAGAAASASAANLMNDFQDGVQQGLQNAGLSEGAAKTIAQGVAGLTAAGVGAAFGSAQGVATAFTVDANNRQLHPNERSLIEKLAKDKAKQECRGNSACEISSAVKWTDLMERAAEGQTDSREYDKNLHYLTALAQTAAQPGSEGALGGVEKYLNDLKTAQLLLAPYTGQPISVNGQIMTANGAQQTYFSATAEQRANPYANTFLGQLPSSIAAGMDQRDQTRLEQLIALNGAATPSYPVEEFVLGGAIGSRALTTLGRALGEVDVFLAGRATASSGGNISTKQITEEALPVRLSAVEQATLRQLDSLPNTNAQGLLREYIADSYFARNGFTQLEGKCGSGNCFDGVYVKGDKVYINEVKPLNANGSIKLSGPSGSMDTQMTDDWIKSAIARLENGTAQQKVVAAKIQTSFNDQTLVKVVTGVNANGMTIVKLR